MVLVASFQEKKKQRFLFIFLFLAIPGLIFLIWYKFFPKQPSAPRILNEKPQRIDINFDFLKNPILRDTAVGLTSFEKIPLYNPKDAGRGNPFQPY